MASRTYSEHVIVVRKTRLREADLVLTMLAEDGRQLRAVAKGALKPTGTFASRLELYAESRVLLVEGRSLDIVKEARLDDAHAALRFDYERSICAAPMAELIATATQVELPVPRLFPMTQVAFSTLEHASRSNAFLLMAAYLLKVSSLLGFRPSLSCCAECGDEQPKATGPTWFSHACGGVLCADCAARTRAVILQAETVAWMDALISSTFAQIAEYPVDDATLLQVMRLVQAWVQAHIGSLRSLSFAISEF